IRFGPGIQSLEFDPNYRGKHLQLHFTVEDEGVFTTPWTATITYSIPMGPWDEHVCAENRRGDFSNGSDAAGPTAHKPDFLAGRASIAHCPDQTRRNLARTQNSRQFFAL